MMSFLYSPLNVHFDMLQVLNATDPSIGLKVFSVRFNRDINH